MPAIFKILIVFATMLALTRFKVPLGLALVLGGLTLGAWSGQGGGEVAIHLWGALASGDLWLLLLITAMIIEVGRYMTAGQNAEDIVAATRRWGGRHGRALTLMSMPAVIGLIPMPAGALFSAPFVEQASGEDAISPQWKSAVNYWFRHVWEYWWPLYPGVIIAMQTFDMVKAWQFIGIQILFTPVAVGAGYLFLIRPHVHVLSSPPVKEKPVAVRRVLFLMLPVALVLLAVIVIPLVLEMLVPGVEEATKKLLAMGVGLLASIILIIIDERHVPHRTRLFSSLLKKNAVNVMLSLGGVLIFKYLLEQSGLLPLASVELVESGIPLVVAVAALPFLAGLVTGIAVGFTGIAFPLVVGLLVSEGSEMTPLAALVLAYGVGYMGMILSPVHLCLLVTRDYFKAAIAQVYRMVLPCVISVLAVTVLMHIILRALEW